MKWEFSRDLVKGNFNDYEDISLTNVMFFKEEVANKTVKFETFREVCFKNCKFSKVSFDNNFMGKVQFLNCEFIDVSFVESNLSKVMFINCKFTDVSFFESTLSDIEIIESLMQYSKIENSTLKDAKLDDVRLNENIHRHNKYHNVIFYKCELVAENFIDTKFGDCDLKTSSFKGVNINLDDLITSKLSMLNIIEILSDKGILIED